MKLKDKVAIITGVSSSIGIGRAIAIAFAREGADVVVCDINYEGVQERAREIERLGIRSLGIKTDVSKASDVSHLMEVTIDKFGRIDILVNNAGILGDRKLIQDITEEEWDAVLNVNIKGQFLCVKYVVPHMLKQGRGKIINIASAGGVVARPTYGPYCASKGAVIQFTRELATELAPHKINVNGIGPGVIETELDPGVTDDPKGREMSLAATPFGRLGKPEDIAVTAVFLASDESEFINGHTIFSDGGLLCL